MRSTREKKKEKREGVGEEMNGNGVVRVSDENARPSCGAEEGERERESVRYKKVPPPLFFLDNRRMGNAD